MKTNIDPDTLTLDIVRDSVPSYKPPTTIAMLKVIRELTGLGLYSAHKLLDKLESEEKGEKQQSS